MTEMRNAAHHQAQVKVAVYTTAQAPSIGEQRCLHESLAFTLLGLSALFMFWFG